MRRTIVVFLTFNVAIIFFSYYTWILRMNFESDDNAVGSRLSESDNERTLDRYIAIHNKIMNGEQPFKVSLNYLNDNGYGNRL